MLVKEMRKLLEELEEKGMGESQILYEIGKDYNTNQDISYLGIRTVYSYKSYEFDENIILSACRYRQEDRCNLIFGK